MQVNELFRSLQGEASTAGWPTAEGARTTGAPEAAYTAAASLLAAAADQESLLAKTLEVSGAGESCGLGWTCIAHGGRADGL